MLGVHGGMSTLLKQHVPFLVSNHCIAHRLALACGQAAKEIAYLKRVKDLLDQLYHYYENSPVHMAGLKAIQEVLNDPQLKLTQAKDVRWLSHENLMSQLALWSMEQPASNFLPNWRVDYFRATSERFSDTIYPFGTAFEGAIVLCVRYLE